MDKPCLHEYLKGALEFSSERYYSCRDCNTELSREELRGWEQAIAAMRARGVEFSAEIERGNVEWMGPNGSYYAHDDGASLGMEPGKRYIIVALPAETSDVSS